jgi:hypothetical protein
MKRYAYMAVGCLLALALVAGAESITKEFFGSSYGTATVAGDSTTQRTTLTVDQVNASTVTATVVTANYTNAAVSGTMTVAGASTLTGALTLGSTITRNVARTAAPTNALSGGTLITIQGTNYWIGLYPVNN